MKKNVASIVFLGCTVIAVLLALTVTVILYVQYLFVVAIFSALASGIAVRFFVQKMAFLPPFFYGHKCPGENGFIVGPVSESKPELVPGRLPADSAYGYGNFPPNLNDALFVTLAHTIPELNVKAGLAHAGRDNEVYFKTLRRFCEEYDEYIREIVCLTAEESWMDYSTRLRLLKDLFAAMGNEHLSMWAHKLELGIGECDKTACKNETEPFCYAMYQFREKLASAVFLETTGDKNENNR